MAGQTSRQNRALRRANLQWNAVPGSEDADDSVSLLPPPVANPVLRQHVPLSRRRRNLRRAHLQWNAVLGSEDADESASFLPPPFTTPVLRVSVSMIDGNAAVIELGSQAGSCEGTCEQQSALANQKVGVEISSSVVKGVARFRGQPSDLRRAQRRAHLQEAWQEVDFMSAQWSDNSTEEDSTGASSLSTSSAQSLREWRSDAVGALPRSSLVLNSELEQCATSFSMLGDPVKVDVCLALLTHPLKIDLADLAAEYSR